MRIATLLPSATEIVYALGREPVGVSHECDFPPEAREKPAITRSRVDTDETATSAEIDEAVLAADEGEGVYDVRVDVLRQLAPDLVVTQGICDVCAVDELLVERALHEAGLEADLLTTDPHHLEDVFEDVRRIGTAIDRERRAHELVERLRTRVDRVHERTIGVDSPPRVALLDWTDPAMVAGHWVPEMVELAGGEYGLADPGQQSRPVEWAAIREYDPEVLVVAPCGFTVSQTHRNLADLTDRPGWEEVTAVRNDRAYVLDGHHYCNRPGPRLVDSLEFLAWTIHPDRFERPPTDAVRRVSRLRESSPVASPE